VSYRLTFASRPRVGEPVGGGRATARTAASLENGPVASSARRPVGGQSTTARTSSSSSSSLENGAVRAGGAHSSVRNGARVMRDDHEGRVRVSTRTRPTRSTERRCSPRGVISRVAVFAVSTSGGSRASEAWFEISPSRLRAFALFRAPRLRDTPARLRDRLHDASRLRDALAPSRCQARLPLRSRRHTFENQPPTLPSNERRAPARASSSSLRPGSSVAAGSDSSGEVPSRPS
jgi:hypothetical protein